MELLIQHARHIIDLSEQLLHEEAGKLNKEQRQFVERLRAKAGQYLELSRAYLKMDKLDRQTSHTWRTPLVVIVGFADLLLEEALGTLNEAQKALLTEIYQDAMTLQQLVLSLQIQL